MKGSARALPFYVLEARGAVHGPAFLNLDLSETPDLSRLAPGTKGPSLLIVPAPYDLIAKQWNAARQDFRPGEEDFIDLLLDSLSPSSRILDLGCGTGAPNATHLAAAGHRIHGIDASEKLLQIARDHLPDATFELGSLEDRSALPGPFDGALCWDALFHLDRKLHQAVFERVANSLRPGALFLLTSGGSANDPFTDTMWDVEFSYDAHPPEETERILLKAGFEILRSSLLEKPTGGRNKGRLAIAATRI